MPIVDTPAPVVAAAPPVPRRRRPSRAAILLAAATVLTMAVASIWIGSAIVTASRGFDTTDEGFYLLSYRWWSVNLRTFTGVQYLYGPVFQALGYDIADLRLFRLATILVTHALLGWAFMRWLRTRRPDAPATKWWEVSGAAAIVAAGGLSYSWLPLTPAYNDVAMLGAMLEAAVVLRIAADAERVRRTPGWVPAVLGAVVVATALAKWASMPPTLFVAGAAGLAVAAPSGRRAVLRLVAWTAAGAGLTVAAIQLLVIPLPAALSAIISTNKLVAATFNSPGLIFVRYGEAAGEMLRAVLDRHWFLLVAALLAGLARGRWATVAAGSIAAGAVGLSAYRIVTDGWALGGPVHIRAYPSSVVLALLVALVAGAAARRRRRGDRGTRSWRTPVVLAMLLLLPLAQGVGSGMPVHLLAVDAFAMWLAVMIALGTGIRPGWSAARPLIAVAVAGVVLLSASIGTDSMLRHPYRSRPAADLTTRARGVPALSSLRLDRATAVQYAGLTRRLHPWMARPGRAVMGFDRMAGLVLMLGGRQVGEAWYSTQDRTRTAAGIRAECPGGRGWWGDRAPILLFNRPVSSVELAALGSCGLTLDQYRVLAPPAQTMGLTVYVPRATEG